jgi:hypothetical protein
MRSGAVISDIIASQLRSRDHKCEAKVVKRSITWTTRILRLARRRRDFDREPGWYPPANLVDVKIARGQRKPIDTPERKKYPHD